MKAADQEVQEYKQLVRRHTPSRPLARNVLAAFLVGGAISVVGQLILSAFLAGGMPLKEAAPPTAAIMLSLGAILTGFGLYDKLAPIAGMGAVLPITGFANAIVAPALEAKREGYVLGVGMSLFSIAGPVIVYGLLTAIVSAGIRFWWLGAA